MNLPRQAAKAVAVATVAATFFAAFASVPATPAPKSVAATASPFDAILDEYRPYLDVDDPLGFGLKLRAIAGDEYRFWRGTKGRFYDWCRAHAADWLARADDRVPAHGDLHFGNVGLYAAGPDLGDVGFGMVDFDDAQRLPFQAELLHLFVTARLVASTLDRPIDVAAFDRATIDAYRAALTSGRTATELLADDPIVAATTAKARDVEYGEELAKFCEVDGTFRPRAGKYRDPSDLFDAIDDPGRWDAFAAAVAQAAASDAGLREQLGTADRTTIRGRLVSVARRTRLKSSGSQGLHKYFVRLWRPHGHALIVYLKQQIPTAAERSGFVMPDVQAPGERAAAMATALADPRPIVNASASLEGGSYLVSLREPWSDELDADDVKSADDLRHFCRIAATVAGAAHGAEGRGSTLAARVDEALSRELAARADAYLAEMRPAFAALREDARVRAAIARTESAVAARK